ncbi:MAG: hypothetical protein UU73_C0001G0318 [Candidatus Daviesbacteria bacterium GW2011_GWA1_41_61]|uniref:Phosphoglycerate mutase n=1 Tax=Candidatus Daviesbacteria bacterium GW2011_GWA2_40_9 TaxID=1618424 RepID=A0A0G0U025_9BACT|nr:MAG: hypothetical protein UU26_C0025G0004 [Candidatus Daviesbacteria bacterium GW2011_GWC1_40_9]KKR82504.1 MAG: hypothetical protein UU29_C0012G0042 [Candidatus Daviesbacteria bacterium GW2011_GWA2_40_9]KKR93137.1 MAG: hypothetical protein UU44_C0004G0319 [Candidatus Daviesbacteria bacterium GW2011_GWB1_41_15]KKS15681.1 MAG: hypothetical protein UU73_C0001G0318 [Candidatus Daviesbacteria bacterium GW2011_GWA1_41_61]
METSDAREIKEQELTSRKAVLHFIRHGEAEYKKVEDYEGNLTEKGRQQARQAGEKLFNDLSDGAVVAFHSSSRLRTIQTAQEIQAEVAELVRKSGKNIVLHNERPKAFSRLAVSDKATEEWLNVLFKGQNPLDYFLDNPTEAVEKSRENFNSYLSKLANFAKKLSPQGPDVHIVVITHTGPSEVLIQGLTGQRPEGSLVNCEEFKISLPVSGQEPTLIYKGLRLEIKNP